MCERISRHSTASNEKGQFSPKVSALQTGYRDSGAFSLLLYPDFKFMQVFQIGISMF